MIVKANFALNDGTVNRLIRALTLKQALLLIILVKIKIAHDKAWQWWVELIDMQVLEGLRVH